MALLIVQSKGAGFLLVSVSYQITCPHDCTLLRCAISKRHAFFIVDYLTGKGYKVVAKEYLEKLYAEQQTSKSVAFNQKTAVKGNNFSATGYYINVSITDDYLQVQIINVSTGEYDGNAIVNF